MNSINLLKKGLSICNICWKFEYRTNVFAFDAERYEDAMFKKCKTPCKSNGNTGYICKSCDRSSKKGNMHSQAQANGMHLNETFDEINDLCPLELSLVSQIIPFIFIVPRHRGAQHGLRG